MGGWRDPLLCVLALVVSADLSDARQAKRPTMVAAAANLSIALTEVAAAFEHEHGSRVELVFGASGSLTRQIQDGAPFELFLAADEEFPGRLTGAGLTRDPGIVYATGRLVIFAPAGSPLTPDAQLEDLGRLVKTGMVGRFAIANPDVAPYGRAAEAVLRKHGLWEALRSNLVIGDSITQAAQFAATGNAVGALIAHSLALTPELAGRGTYALIPDDDYPPLRQRMVLLKRAGPQAQQFYDFVQGGAAKLILTKHGFSVPD